MQRLSSRSILARSSNQPGLDVRQLINVAGPQPSTLVSYADGVRFHGCAAVEASRSGDAQDALRHRIEAAARASACTDSRGSRRTADG